MGISIKDESQRSNSSINTLKFSKNSIWYDKYYYELYILADIIIKLLVCLHTIYFIHFRPKQDIEKYINTNQLGKRISA